MSFDISLQVKSQKSKVERKVPSNKYQVKSKSVIQQNPRNQQQAVGTQNIASLRLASRISKLAAYFHAKLCAPRRMRVNPENRFEMRDARCE